MRPSDANAGYVWDMIEAAREVVKFVAETTFETYATDLLRIRAVERSIQNLGEAASCVDRQFKENYPSVPWKEITGQRHVLVHDYGEVDQKRIWLVATKEIPTLTPVSNRS